MPYRIICFGIVRAMDPVDFLKELMRRSGDNPNSLAVKLNNKTKQPQIYKFLEGIAKEPRRSTLQPVADFYKVAIEAFYSPEIASSELQRLDKGGSQGYANLTVPGLHASATGGPKVIELENNPEYPAIRRVKLKAQAGVSGFSVEYQAEDDGPPIVFRADWYRLKGYRPEKMLALRVKGDSMIPSMYEDDLIVINTLSTEPKQGIPFLVSYEGEVVVKRLVRDDGLWWLTSDNPDQRRYPRTKCNGGTEIIGEVVYRQTERV